MAAVVSLLPVYTGLRKMRLDPYSGSVVQLSDLIVGRLQCELFQEVTPRGLVPRNVMSDNKFTSLDLVLRRPSLNRCADGNVGTQEGA